MRPANPLLLAAVLYIACGYLLAAEPSLPGSDAKVPQVTFESDIQPLLTRYGCNSGPCHGKSRGQNGFALSLLGFDSDFDHFALVREGRGRRVFPAAPEYSLLIRKATGELPHGGGKRIEIGSAHYEMLKEWIGSGSARTPSDAPKLMRVVVDPPNKSLVPKEQLQLKVFAEYSDGTRRDVTDGAAFQSNDQTIAAVSSESAGTVQAGPISGEAAVMARYMNNIAVCNITIPLAGEIPASQYEALPHNSEIDTLVWHKLKLMGLLPSVPATESTWHRRTYLRIIGRLPTPAETRTYLADSDPNRRKQLVDQLLDRPEYVDFWANKWTDLLRPNPYRAGIKAVRSLDNWVREAFRKNMPYDQFVRELLTAKGSTWRNGATVIFRDRPDTVEIGASASQLFLGIRLECAKCHHHPFEVWSQDDFYGFAAFFANVGHKGTGLSPPISGGEEIIMTKASGELRHGRTGAVVSPKTLTGKAYDPSSGVEPREALVNWMTESSNPYFAKVMASRIWFELMGQGLVDPVDDIRATNPASNEPLLEFLAKDFRESGYDIKHLIRRIVASNVFSLSSTPGERNIADIKNFSRYYRQRLRAEVLLDAVNDVLGTQEDFAAMPVGSRATQLWTFRSSSVFLDTFGRPDANQDPPCERTYESTTPQVLHLMNSPVLNSKLSLDAARPAKLSASEMTNSEVVDEAYLLTYCRLPSAQEKQLAVASFPAGKDRRQAVEDLFWVLMNTPEFYFVD